ncbi:hypothetical protein [Desulforamulus aeronauticus]|uniref:Uncharacterized protein n=1 Tax=Desulforamulus aeronauticus DSM 10349 TaxID=1121421 RepID=A0A1M6WFA1_9FIRM|nr:hypothetical protein [Desulforamulus aeronauticus]SHK92339.1 hypothetical protein SAMN02745123_03599 [Desulforamulus aeronauticus DSM 10349]
MEYKVETLHGIFLVIQSMSYGEMLIAGILVVIATILGFKTIYEIADKEGYI